MNTQENQNAQHAAQSPELRYNNLVSCYTVDQIVWDSDHKVGTRCRLTVLAKTIAEAAQVAGEDEMHQIERLQCVGVISQTPNDKYRAQAIS